MNDFACTACIRTAANSPDAPFWLSKQRAFSAIVGPGRSQEQNDKKRRRCGRGHTGDKKGWVGLMFSRMGVRYL